MNLKKHIAGHVRGIPRSGIRDFFEVVQTMDDVISLGIGEPDFDTPWHIREAAIYSLEKGRTGYTSNLGLPRLRSAIADYVRAILQGELRGADGSHRHRRCLRRRSTSPCAHC